MAKKKIFFLAALRLSMMAQAVEMDYYKTLVDEQASATAGQTQLYNLDYAADGSLVLLSSYQTANSGEVGMTFDGQSYQGGTAAKWPDLKVSNMRNAFFAKLDANGDVLWAKADTTGDFDLAYSAIAVRNNGEVLFAQKFRTRKGVYMGFINLYNAAGQVVASNSMSFTNYDSIVVDGKNVKRKEAFSWAGITMDEDSFVYVAGLQGDTLLPVWNDSIAPRVAWNTKGNLSNNCNTVILKYKAQYNTFMDLDYVGAVINSDVLDYDRPLGLHYENGKLYVAGTYKNGVETGIYAARYSTDLTREYIAYHPINGSLQFQQTKFVDGKIYVCGGFAKGSITIGEKTLATTGNFNHGLVYVMSMADGSVVDADVHAAANNALNITIGAFPTADGVVAYNYEFGNLKALHYDANMNLVSADTLGIGGAQSTITCVARTEDGNHTAVGMRARSTAPYYLLSEPAMQFTNTNWYSLIAVLDADGQTTAIDEIVNRQSSNTKGVYTITGFYLGENADNLPKGVYIINGKKVVR